MIYRQLTRLGGSFLVAGFVAFVLVLFIRWLGDASATGREPRSMIVVINVLQFVGAVSSLLGLPLVLAALASRIGLLGQMGMALIWMDGLITILFLLLPPNVVVSRYLGDALVLGEVAGAVLLSIPILRGRLVTTWPGFVLLVGALVSPPLATRVTSVFSNGGLSPLVHSYVFASLTPLLIWTALGWLGYQAVITPDTKGGLKVAVPGQA